LRCTGAVGVNADEGDVEVVNIWEEEASRDDMPLLRLNERCDRTGVVVWVDRFMVMESLPGCACKWVNMGGT
jgi:hypothetical protein